MARETDRHGPGRLDADPVPDEVRRHWRDAGGSARLGASAAWQPPAILKQEPDPLPDRRALVELAEAPLGGSRTDGEGSAVRSCVALAYSIPRDSPTLLFSLRSWAGPWELPEQVQL